MKLCEYGCGQEARFQFKNGKWCCEDHYMRCPIQRKKNSLQIKEAWKKISSWKKKKSNKMKKMWADPNSNYNSILYKKKLSNIKKPTIKNIKEKYPFFSKIEEMRYNPDKPLEEREIQVHCKNHECKNSKEKGGWFTPTSHQLIYRKNILENEGEDKYYFYCSQHCKDTCILFNLQSDPFKSNNLPYTYTEYQTFRTFVLERDNHICQFCGKPATHVHHERPQKLEPFFTLDPDYAWSCCEKCHCEKGHQDECSTGNLAKIVCSVESQKFLNQKIKFRG